MEANMNICDENLDDCPFLNNEDLTEWELTDYYQLRDRCKSGRNCAFLDNIIYHLENEENEGEE